MGAVNYQNYVVATNGVIQVITPGKNLSTSYKSEDEADVRDVVWDADGLAFHYELVTSSPVVTRWSAKDVAVRRRLALKKTINGVNFDDFPLWRGVTTKDGKRLLVAYIDGTLGIWDLEKAELVQILAPDKPPAGSPSDLAVSPDGATAVRADGNGSFVIFDIPNKTSRTISTSTTSQPWRFNFWTTVASQSNRRAVIFSRSTHAAASRKRTSSMR